MIKCQPAMAPRPSLAHRLAAEDLAAVDASSSPVRQAGSISSSSGLSSAPSRLATPSCERDTAPRETTPAPRPTVPPTPVSLLRRRVLAASSATLAGYEKEDGTPSPTVVPRTQRVEQAAFRATFEVAVSQLQPYVLRRSRKGKWRQKPRVDRQDGDSLAWLPRLAGEGRQRVCRDAQL